MFVARDEITLILKAEIYRLMKASRAKGTLLLVFFWHVVIRVLE